MAQKCNINAINCHLDNTLANNDDLLFDIPQINNHLINSVQVSNCDTNTSYTLNMSSITQAEENTKMVKTLELSSTKLPLASTFQFSARHTDVSPEDIRRR